MRFAVLTSLVFTALVAATGGNTCNGGDTYCCNSSPLLGNAATGFLPVPVAAMVTLACDKIAGIGIPIGGTCDKTTVCCQDMGANGIINIQCIGITV